MAIEEGTPHERILEYVDDHDVDLIVMGTHGRRGLDRFLLGSVTERVLRGASASVLVTRLAGTAMDSAASAIDTARDALEADGYDDVTILEEPYEQGGYWIVRADDGTALFNVHIDRVTGNTQIARIQQR